MSPRRGAYPAEFRREAVAKLRAGRELGELAAELGVTPTTLRVWLSNAEGRPHRPHLEREDVMALADDAFRRLDGALKLAPVSALARPMGFTAEAIDPWRIADAVAHVAHYKAHVIQQLAARERSAQMEDRRMDEYCDRGAWEELRDADPVYNSMDAFTRKRHGYNHLVYERWRDARPKEILAWHRSVHRYVMGRLENAPDSWFSRAGGRPPRLSYSRIGVISHHVNTHRKDIERALGGR